MLTYEQKKELYQAGRYVMAVPSVPTQHWTTIHWINWIDATGGWKTDEAIKRQSAREQQMIEDFYNEHDRGNTNSDG